MIDLADIDAAVGSVAVDAAGVRVGRVEAFHRSQDGRQPLLVAVTTDGGRRVLVPLVEARLQDGVLHLGFLRAVIEDAPIVDGRPTDEEQATVLDRFDGLAGGTPSGVGSTPAGLVDDAADAPSAGLVHPFGHGRRPA